MREREREQKTTSKTVRSESEVRVNVSNEHFMLILIFNSCGDVSDTVKKNDPKALLYMLYIVKTCTTHSTCESEMKKEKKKKAFCCSF